MESDPNQVLIAAMRDRMPSLKTQAQLLAFMAGFDSLCLHLEAIFSGRTDDQKITDKALRDSIDLAYRATVIVERVADTAVPVDPVFLDAPKEFGERAVAEGLLEELDRQDAQSLEEWYRASKSKFDNVVTQSLRNQLFDAVRAKQVSFRRVTF